MTWQLIALLSGLLYVVVVALILVFLHGARGLEEG